MDRSLPRGGAHVLAFVGEVRLAVPAAWVQEVLVPEGAAVLPRHQAALVGLLSTPNGLLPLVDLVRWVRVPGHAASHEAAVLVLHHAGRRVGVKVDRLGGLCQLADAAIQRVCQRDDPDELFDCVALASDGGPPLCLLDVERLMALTQVWMEQAGDAAAAQGGPEASSARAVRAAATQDVLLLRVGAHRLALPCALVAELLPMPGLSQRWQGSGPSMGLASWRDRPVAVLDLGLHAQAAPPWAVVMRDAEGLALMLGIDEVVGLAAAPAGSDAPQDGETWWGGRWLDPAHGECRSLRVAALLEALPEAALGRPAERTARAAAAPPAQATRHNAEPYMVVEAGGCFAVPVSQVHAVVAQAPLQADAEAAQLLAWRGLSLPIAQVPGLPPARVGDTLMVVGGPGQERALRVDRLLSLVPARGGELMALPGRAGEAMLCTQQPAASYRVLSLATP